MKNNINDNFEKVYLRVGLLKRAIDKMSQERINEIFADPNFQRCVTHIAKNTYQKNKAFLSTHGFMWEDILSIAKIFGLNFYGTNAVCPTKTDECYLLMHYVNQRFYRFTKWAHKKFGSDEKVYELPVDEKVWAVIADPESVVVEEQEALTVDQVMEDKNEQLESIEKNIINIRQTMRIDTSSKDELLKIKSKMTHKRKSLQSEITDLHSRRRQEKKQVTNLTKKLKKTLDKEWPKHSGTLAYYSTSKHVAHDVRKRARMFCAKYKIDFKKWAQDQIDSGKIDSNELVVG